MDCGKLNFTFSSMGELALFYIYHCFYNSQKGSPKGDWDAGVLLHLYNNKNKWDEERAHS